MTKLPQKLAQMITTIEEEQENYPSREQDLKTLQRYIDSGVLDLADSTAERIVEQQRAVRQTREHGLPAYLQQLCDAVQNEAEPYRDREQDLKTLQRYIESGDLDLAESTAERIVEQQRAVKQTREHGLPAYLQQLCDAVQNEAEPYRGREQDLKTLQRYIESGDLDLAESTAERIVEQQRAVKQTRENGLPAYLQQLCDAVQNEAEPYRDREQDLQTLQRYIESGDLDLAESTAERIVEQQRAVKQMREHGLPNYLQQLCDTVQNEAEPYRDREQDLKTVQRYIESGDVDLAESTAERIIEQQRALKQMRDG